MIVHILPIERVLSTPIVLLWFWFHSIRRVREHHIRLLPVHSLSTLASIEVESEHITLCSPKATNRLI